jgi:hypothetical protein
MDGALVIADDYSEPDGDGVLSFGQAQERAKARQTAGAAGQLTVQQAVKSYLESKEADGRILLIHDAVLSPISIRRSAPRNAQT